MSSRGTSTSRFRTPAWNLSTAEASEVRPVLERFRTGGLTEIRLMDPAVPTVFITSEGYVRNGEFVSGNSGDLRMKSLTAICRGH